MKRADALRYASYVKRDRRQITVDKHLPCLFVAVFHAKRKTFFFVPANTRYIVCLAQKVLSADEKHNFLLVTKELYYIYHIFG